MLAATICAVLAARGLRVAAFKPVVTGLDEAGEGAAGDPEARAPGGAQPAAAWPPDHELLAAAASAGQAPDEVAPLRFGPAVSPHHAADLAGARIEPAELVATARAAAERADVLVCEGVGGLMVPLTPGYLVRDLAVDLGLPLAVAARPGLGTINHSLLTVEAARAAGLDVRAVVLTPWPAEPSAMERSNRETVAALGAVAVEVLPAATPDRLAEAGAALPLDAWLDPRS